MLLSFFSSPSPSFFSCFWDQHQISSCPFQSMPQRMNLIGRLTDRGWTGVCLSDTKMFLSFSSVQQLQWISPQRKYISACTPVMSQLPACLAVIYGLICAGLWRSGGLDQVRWWRGRVEVVRHSSDRQTEEVWPADRLKFRCVQTQSALRPCWPAEGAGEAAPRPHRSMFFMYVHILCFYVIWIVYSVIL